MTRTIRLALVAALAVACADHDPTVPDLEAGADRAISDGGSGGNPHFFFLPPMSSQPDAALLSAFEPSANPVVRVACHASNQGGCDDFATLVFGVGTGVELGSDHYKLDFDTKAYDGLQTSDDGVFTTYRIRVEVSLDLDELGALTFLLGYADFQLAANGREAKNISSGDDELIGLVDGRTLPVRFRIDRGALEVELKEATAELGDDAVCQTNCSVTFIDPAEEETVASLADADGQLATAMLFREGDVIENSVLIIDELDDETECAPGTSLRKKNCFRYTILPGTVDSEDGHRFADEVRFGICPVGVPLGQGTQWALFRVSGDVVERPQEREVDDFLPCAHAFASASPWGGLHRLALAAFDWLVPPLLAGDCGDGRHDCWGGGLRDISDLFWGLDAEMTVVEAPGSGPVLEGTMLSMTVRIMAVHSDPTPVAEAEVEFRITDGAGTLVLGEDEVLPPGSVDMEDDRIVAVRRLTDSEGLATAMWQVEVDANTLVASSPVALPPADGSNEVTVIGEPAVADLMVDDLAFSPLEPEPGPVTFSARILNLGPGAASASLTGFGFRELGTGELQSFEIETEPLTADLGTHVTREVTLSAGQWRWVVTADIDETVDDDDRGNNTAELLLSLGEQLVYGHVATALADNAACALTTDGGAYCWGANNVGQLGTGEPSPDNCGGTDAACSHHPVAVAGGLAFSALDAGGGHMCGVADGAAYCWGFNVRGQLGDGTNQARPVPTAVLDPLAGPVTWSRISAGSQVTCGTGVQGDLYCWGFQSAGSLGTGSTLGGDVHRPVPVSLDSAGAVTFVDVSVGAGSSSCALGDAGGVYCWGDNRWGAVGELSGQLCGTAECRPRPVPIADGLGVEFVQVSVGFRHACAVTQAGEAYCWGENAFGQLGASSSDVCTGGFACSRTPVLAAAPEPFTQISAGFRHTCGVTAEGAAYCWGLNQDAQLGLGFASNAVSAPTRVGDPLAGPDFGAPDPAPAFYTAVSGGNGHSCALTAGGHVHCWGAPGWGQVGRGEPSAYISPFQPYQVRPARIYEPRP